MASGQIAQDEQQATNEAVLSQVFARSAMLPCMKARYWPIAALGEYSAAIGCPKRTFIGMAPGIQPNAAGIDGRFASRQKTASSTELMERKMSKPDFR